MFNKVNIWLIYGLYMVYVWLMWFSDLVMYSMGDLQDPTTWRYVNVPYVCPYFVGIFPET